MCNVASMLFDRIKEGTISITTQAKIARTLEIKLMIVSNDTLTNLVNDLI